MQQQEVVILYGDMSIRPFEYVRRTPNFDQANWPECASATRVSSQSSVLLEKLPTTRTQHTAYISELSRVNNEVLFSSLLFFTLLYLPRHSCFLRILHDKYDVRHEAPTSTM